ncbi:hypothetical protein [Klebsiella aerogenes]|uniref:hypothetical protein n=1 Tax=Klebsiella aerogenes TaxID=548 RepID=UPI000E2FD04C|nr:hypothetical protein [Klebsiella aerogenes]
MNNENELTAALLTIEKSKEESGCPAGVDLQDWVKQLAAENVGLKTANAIALQILNDEETMVTSLWASSIQKVEEKTPATDRIVAGIKADEEKAVLNDLLRHLDKIDIENISSPWELSSEVVAFVNSRLLREGADK